MPVCLCGSVRTAAQMPWWTAANYSNLSARWHIMAKYQTVSGFILITSSLLHT